MFRRKFSAKCITVFCDALTNGARLVIIDSVRVGVGVVDNAVTVSRKPVISQTPPPPQFGFSRHALFKPCHHVTCIIHKKNPLVRSVVVSFFKIKMVLVRSDSILSFLLSLVYSQHVLPFLNAESDPRG